MDINEEQLSYLAKVNIFADLDKADLASLQNVSPIVTVAAGTVLLRPDGPRPGLFLLKRGRVRLYRLSNDGKIVTLTILGDGTVFGSTESIALNGRNIHAESMDNCLICIMRQPDVERVIRQYPKVGLRIMQILSSRLADLEDLTESLANDDVRRRVLHLLTHLGKQFGVPDGNFLRLDLPLTHADIASMVGSTRETVTSTLSTLARDGLVRTNRRQLWIEPERVSMALNALAPV